jgi:hypothetical protein
MKIQSLEMQQAIQRATKYNPSEGSPAEFNDKVQLTCDVNPFNLQPQVKIANVTKATTGSVGLINVLAPGYERYILAVSLSVVKDVVCDTATGGGTYVSCNIDGATVALITAPVITLTAQSTTQYIAFSHPLKVNNNAISLVQSFTAGVCVAIAVVSYFDIAV